MKPLSDAELAEIDAFAAEAGLLEEADEDTSIETLIVQMEQSMSLTETLLSAETTPPAVSSTEVHAEVRALAVRLESLAQDLAELHARIS